MGVAVQGVDQGRCGCPYLGEDLRGSDASGHALLVRDVVNVTVSCEGFGRIPPQGDPQADSDTTSDKMGW